MEPAPTTLVSAETRQKLDVLSSAEKRPAAAVLDDAVKEYASRHEAHPVDWKEAWRQAKGMWKDRTDLPDFVELRRSWDRDVWIRRDEP